MVAGALTAAQRWLGDRRLAGVGHRIVHGGNAFDRPVYVDAAVEARLHAIVFGMLFANCCTWAHAINAAASVLDLERSALLSASEIAALDGKGDPLVLKRA